MGELLANGVWRHSAAVALVLVATRTAGRGLLTSVASPPVVAGEQLKGRTKLAEIERGESLGGEREDFDRKRSEATRRNRTNQPVDRRFEDITKQKSTF